ncbi:MAG TPA: glycosyltransferase family 39 protein [Burkholderiaceae bacterium]|nr:glycosyltransferase family 39 protein [Burkholderiaceae bacterium]
MNLAARPSPARVSAAAAAQLPRWALAVVLAVYSLAGLFGRDPWYQDDAAGFGVMWTMAHGTAVDWWLPNVIGVPHLEEGPLPFWMGALCITLFGSWLGDALAARLSSLVWMLLTTGSLWYATYRLARREEAQPIAFAFGGEASGRDYACMLADIAALLFLATIGVVVRMHETTAETASIAWVAFALYGLAISLNAPARGALATGVAVGALLLSRGPLPAAMLLLGMVLATRWSVRGARLALFAAITGGVAVACFGLWFVGALLVDRAAAETYFQGWSAWAVGSVGVAQLYQLTWIARNILWYTWPLWPLALWALYSWRHSLTAPHIAAPATAFAAMFAAMLLSGAVNEAALMLTVPPLVVLGAFGASTLRRGAENVIDWFAIALFSLLSLAAWGYFIAMLTGIPPKMAASVARMTPGFTPAFDAAAVLLGILTTLVWLALVIWRVRTNPPMLWRGPVLAAAGLTALWALLNALFLPAVNYNRTFAGIAQQAAAQLVSAGRPDACVVAHHLLPAHRILFAFHGGIRFAPPGGAQSCPFALHRDTQRTHLDDEPPPGSWTPLWEGQWPTRREETIRIYRRPGT